MEKRFFLAIALSITVFLVWSKFFAPELPQPDPSSEIQQTEQLHTPETSADTPTSRPITPVSDSSENTNTTSSNDLPSVEATPIPEKRTITIDTPLYTAELDTMGARFISWKLKNHLNENGEPIEMISSEEPLHYPGDIRINNHNTFSETVFNSNYSKDVLVLTESDGEQTLELSAQLATGEYLQKTLMFHGDNYLVNMDTTLANKGSVAISGRIEYLLPDRLLSGMTSQSNNRYIRSGPVFWDGQERELPKINKVNGHLEFANVKWAAIQENYFFAGIAPFNQLARGFVEAGRKNIDNGKTETAYPGLLIEARTLNPGDTILQNVLLILGPKKYDKLSELNIGIENIVDFGWIELLGKLFYHIIISSFSYLKNYGLCIILITFCVKVLLLPLSIKQMDSMKKMQAIQPQMKAIQEKYKKEPQKQQQELGKLYKQHGVNPMGGCLPMFIQFPVFIALYQVLMNLIEMRGASFLWVSDLSQPNPILVLIMGVSMIVQQKMTPTTGDPKQARMMMLLPIVFTAMFWNFPSGLVLYWLTNNILTIGQQMIIHRRSDDKTDDEPRLKARARKKLGTSDSN